MYNYLIENAINQDLQTLSNNYIDNICINWTNDGAGRESTLNIDLYNMLIKNGNKTRCKTIYNTIILSSNAESIVNNIAIFTAFFLKATSEELKNAKLCGNNDEIAESEKVIKKLDYIIAVFFPGFCYEEKTETITTKKASCKAVYNDNDEIIEQCGHVATYNGLTFFIACKNKDNKKMYYVSLPGANLLCDHCAFSSVKAAKIFIYKNAESIKSVINSKMLAYAEKFINKLTSNGVVCPICMQSFEEIKKIAISEETAQEETTNERQAEEVGANKEHPRRKIGATIDAETIKASASATNSATLKKKTAKPGANITNKQTENVESVADSVDVATVRTLPPFERVDVLKVLHIAQVFNVAQVLHTFNRSKNRYTFNTC